MNKRSILILMLLLLATVACNLPLATTPQPPTATVELTAGSPVTPTATMPEPAATLITPTQPTAGEEPQRVVFEQGATSATVEGTVAAGATAEYYLYALEGQEMTAVLTAPPGSAAVEVVSPDDEILVSASENRTSWTGSLPSTGDYLIRVVSRAEADASYVLEVTIPPLEGSGGETAEACNLTVQTAITVYRWASTASDVFGTADAGLELSAQYQTPDGWYGFEPGVAQAPNFGVDRMRWILPAEGDITFSPPCPGLPVVLSLEQLRNATYRAMDFEPATLTDGEYQDTSDPAFWQVTAISDNVMSYSDLDGDGDQDSLVVLATSTGGSGTFIEIAAVRNEDGEPEYMGKVFLGDRVPVHHMTVIDDVIHVTATIHDEDDPLCCPSQEVTLKFRFEAGEFVAVEE